MSNKEIVEIVIQAFLENDLEKALPHMADDIQMAWPGYFALKPGKEALKEFFKSIPETLESGTEDFIAEGDKVIGTGYVISKHDDGEIRKSLFADVYYLEDKKIKAIKSYMVFDQSEEE
jgi:ketosteroid isomerase-like protein